MKQKRIILLCGLMTLISLLSCKQEKKTERKKTQKIEVKKPNVIFIMADDLGYADLGSYGQKLIKTPYIDKLANEGMRFTQCYAGSTVCAPSRSVLMTGMQTGHTQVRGNFGIGGVVGLAGNLGRVPLRDEDVTIAEKMKEAGYVTGMVGKWGLGEPNTTGEPNDQGFDEFYGFLNQRRAHSYYPDYIWNNKEKVMLLGNKNGSGTEYTHDLFANYSVDFIKRHKEKPFFLYVPLCIPHSNYEVPDLGIYNNKPWDDEAKAYAAMITRMDNTVGRILQTLKDSGIDENTMVFFTSDNGAAESSQLWKIFESNAPLRGVKRDPYEGGIRVPMIVKYPDKIAAGKTNNLPWYFADVMPTLAELTGVSAPNNIDGQSILATLLGDKQDFSNRAMYWEFYENNGWRATRFGNWKAIQHDMHKIVHQPIEIYNLKDDIGETKNLADEYPEIVKKAKQVFKESHNPSNEYVWKYLKN